MLIWDTAGRHTKNNFKSMTQYQLDMLKHLFFFLFKSTGTACAYFKMY